MLFNSPQFLIFLGCVWGLYWAVRPRFRAGVLLGASVVFYAAWIPQYVLLMFGTIAVNYLVVRGLAAAPNRRKLLALGIGATVGVLAWAKYTSFAVSNLQPAFSLLGVELVDPEVLLPLGISFYSFQIIAFAIDTYKRSAPPAGGFSRYALFISFFPQLIAGPIVRGAELLPQLERGGVWASGRGRRGLRLLVVGLTKKVVFADFLLAPFVDDVFRVAGAGGGPYHLMALYSFAFQIYFDFSGYTDMARGAACLLGFELPRNFAEPYLARNPAEFWRRWHMTLSRWLRDYLYIPLGGNRRGGRRTLVNVMLTMLIGGLWHGAAWTFVLWGGLHGIMLVAHRATRGRTRDRPLALRDLPSVVLCFHAVCAAWILFRAPNLEQARAFVAGLGDWGGPLHWPVLQALVIGLCVGLHALERFARQHRSPAWMRPWAVVLEACAWGLACAAVLAASGTGTEFIYFQF